jgi:hypothetical protein
LALSSASNEIASSFYARILELYGNTDPALRFWTLSPLILQQMLEHFDADRHGMNLIIARCMPPAEQVGGKVRSLREYLALGTPPWPPGLQEGNLFLGAESLVGHAVSSCHVAVIQNVQQDQSFLPAQLAEHERSAAAFPLVLHARCAGCLLVSSTLPGFFRQSRLTIMKHYVQLLVLALPPDEFYEQDRIELQLMPAHALQHSHFSTFRQRVARLLAHSQTSQQRLTPQQAEQLARQQLEEELLQLCQ